VSRRIESADCLGAGAALYGLLKKVRDLGLALVSVNRIAQSKEKNP
jgi:hypothetical protein